MITTSVKKFLSLVLIFFLFQYAFLNSEDNKISNNQEQNYFSDLVDDEIEPFCSAINFDDSNKLNSQLINFIQISLVDKDKWVENFYLLSQDRTDIITDKYKKKFDALIEVNFKNNYVCSYEGKVRLTGDVQDHIVNVNQTSLDVELIDGNLFGIVKFKLFLPETRYGINELIVTSILERMDIVTPRTFQTNVIFNNSKVNKYILQEKIAKELLEYNNFREGPLLQVTEEFFWDKRKQEDNNSLLLFAEIINKYWSRRSLINQQISLEALEKYNELIFNSSWSNNMAVQKSKLTYNNNSTDISELIKFDILMIALDAQHGLALTNRNVHYDNLKNNFIPIYYDGDSQISERLLFSGSPPDLCETFADENYYFRYICVNDYVENAKKIKAELNFSVNDIYESVVSKGGETDIELIETSVSNFLYNLEYLTKQKPDLNPQNVALEDISKFLINTSDYGVKFLFSNSTSNTAKICDQYLNNCADFIQESNFFSKEFIEKYKNIYPFGSSLESFISKSAYQELNSSMIVYGNPTVTRDINNKLLEILFTEPDQRVLIINGEDFIGWEVRLLSNFTLQQNESRLDINSLTGCLTIYDTKVENLSIFSENMNCEDAVNFMKVIGTVENLNIKNSVSDAVDIDFSKMLFDKVNVENAGNDCFDISASFIEINNIELNLCGDKGLSVGEKTDGSIRNLIVSQSKFGIANKDSSNIILYNSEFYDTDVCIALYRKKQEFGPSKLILFDNKCDAKNENFIQAGSVLEKKNQ